MSNRWQQLEGRAAKAWTGIEHPNYRPTIWVPSSQKLDMSVFSAAFAGDPNLGRFPRASARERSIGLLIAKSEELEWLLERQGITPAVGRLLCQNTTTGPKRIRFDIARLEPGSFGHAHYPDGTERLAHGVLIGRQMRDRQNPESPLSWRYALGGVTDVGFIGLRGGVEAGEDPLTMGCFGSGETPWLRDVNFT